MYNQFLKYGFREGDRPFAPLKYTHELMKTRFYIRGICYFRDVYIFYSIILKILKLYNILFLFWGNYSEPLSPLYATANVKICSKIYYIHYYFYNIYFILISTSTYRYLQ
jgi:hypothetical protein